MNKQISSGVGIAIILILAALVLWLAITITRTPFQNAVSVPVKNAATNNQQTGGQKTKDQSCLDSGGAIETSSCCQSASDFPNSCIIGACGCAPASSHQVKTCNCGAGKCFDGNACVDVKLSATGSSVNSSDVVYKNTQYEFQLTLPKGWEAYKTSITKNGGIFNILFYLPTTDKLYSNQNKELKGYADIFSIIIFTTDEWNKQLNSAECKIAGGSVGCFYPKDIIGKNNTYVFSGSFANGVPDDLRNIQQQMIDSSFLEKNFKLL